MDVSPHCDLADTYATDAYFDYGYGEQCEYAEQYEYVDGAFPSVEFEGKQCEHDNQSEDCDDCVSVGSSGVEREEDDEGPTPPVMVDSPRSPQRSSATYRFRFASTPSPPASPAQQL